MSSRRAATTNLVTFCADGRSFIRPFKVALSSIHHSIRRRLPSSIVSQDRFANNPRSFYLVIVVQLAASFDWTDDEAWWVAGDGRTKTAMPNQ